MDELIFDILPEDLEKAIELRTKEGAHMTYRINCDCVVAQAIKRNYPGEYITVGKEHVTIVGLRPVYYRLNADARDIVFKFDARNYNSIEFKLYSAKKSVLVGGKHVETVLF